MSNARDIPGAVFRDGTATLLARIVDADDSPVTQSSLTAAEYSIFQIDPRDPATQSVVTGHDGQALVIADVIFDTLQTGAPWSIDETGYNFRHEIDISTDSAFPAAGAVYQVRYELTPVTGQPIVFRFELRCL
ncbi:hypothetical protein [Adhaeretor mobilis]|uniref:Uncharacterized protein n=1 Tax=Adhaeretor mobilis TaxID=1930276 RepID=A0A517N2A5_9BACT|nr:hypothetical protein [Adhaeretor mobilis]QDT01267.1 hypothetical protein HG15A2_46090 [Adhaeretor mobilis]